MRDRSPIASAGFRSAALLLTLASAGPAACTSLRRVEPADFIAKNGPDVVWVTYPNKAVVPVAEPSVVGDTLKGLQKGTFRPLSIPLDQVQSVEARTPDHTKTILFVTGLGIVWVSSVYLIWVSQAGPNTDGVRCGTDVRGQPLGSC